MTDVMTTVFPTFRAAARGHDRIPFGIIAHCTATVPSPVTVAALPPLRGRTQRAGAAGWYRRTARSGALHRRPRSVGLARCVAALTATPPPPARTHVIAVSLRNLTIRRRIPRRIPECVQWEFYYDGAAAYGAASARDDE